MGEDGRRKSPLLEMGQQRSCPSRRDRLRLLSRYLETLKRNSMMSPSLTTYSLPSRRT
jgi:hypothetical protein